MQTLSAFCDAVRESCNAVRNLVVHATVCEVRTIVLKLFLCCVVTFVVCDCMAAATQAAQLCQHPLYVTAWLQCHKQASCFMHHLA